jgi:hypothetical protein
MLILAAGVLMIMSAVAIAQESQPVASETKSQIEVSEPQYDFGRVAQGTSVSHTFWMKNTGDTAVRINDIKPGCGCTKAPFKAQTLAAGESTHVELIFSTGHYGSHVTKSARILSDESGNVPSLIFHADVRPIMDSLDVFTVQPCKIDLDQNENADEKYDLEYQLALKNRSDQDLSFSVINVPEGLVTLDFPEGKPLGPGEQAIFTARFDEGIASEVFTKSLTIQASDANHTRLTVPISKTMRWGPASTSQR